MGYLRRRISRALLCFVFVLLLVGTECLSNKVAPSILRRRRSHGRRNLSYIRSLTHSVSHSTASGDDFQIFYYNQTLDHFNYKPESYITFKQKYVVNSKYWGGGGPNNTSPIFVYFGQEGALAEFELTGIFSNSAPDFQALLLYIEHRYYGESIPFGSKEIAYKNASTLGYLSMAQALADYAEVIWYVKNKFSAQHCPLIVYGGSYAGELATHFRLKYPHLAIGAWGSSAPILGYNDINERSQYDTIVTKDFREASESCYSAIKQSWDIIDRMGANHKGLKELSKTFNTCSRIKNSDDLKGFLDLMYKDAAQYDAPPDYPVNLICNAMDEMPPGTDPLTTISAGVNAYLRSPCVNITEDDLDSYNNFDPYSFQVCTELYAPTKESTNGTMFQVYPDEEDTGDNDGTTDCRGVPPRPHWVVIEYGGQDIKLVLKKFGSNILFTNGLRDPYSSQGVLQNISDSIIALTTTKGSHCLDMGSISSDDPDWLVSHKIEIIKIMKKWIDQYHTDLTTSLDPIASGANPLKEFMFMCLFSVFSYIFLLNSK